MSTSRNKDDNNTSNEPRHSSHISNEWASHNARNISLDFQGWELPIRRISKSTVFRFFQTVIPWTALFWLFFRRYLWCQKDVYLLAGDEVVIGKAGKTTHGIDRFFSSLINKPILGLSFFTLSLVSVEKRHSFPIKIEQVIKPESKNNNPAIPTDVKSPEKKGRGRPKGSKNKNKTEVVLTPELLRIKSMINSLFNRLSGLIPIIYFVVDGHFGNNNALQMARQVKLHIISKLRHDSRLYIPYKPIDPNHRDNRRKYGDKIDCRNIPQEYLRETTIDKDIQSNIYQATLLHKEFAGALNVVIVVKTNLKTQALCSFHSIF